MENQSIASLTFVVEEVLRLKREIEFHKTELVSQRMQFASAIRSSETNFLAQIKLLEMKLEECYKDKMKFLLLIDELEQEKEQLHSKWRRDVESEKEKATDYNDEVMGCHKYIEKIEKESRAKDRKIKIFEAYMLDKAKERKEMTEKMNDMEDILRRMEIQSEEMEQLKKENEALKEKNSRLNNMVDCLLVPESTSDERSDKSETESVVPSLSLYEKGAESLDSEDDAHSEGTSYEDDSDKLSDRQQPPLA